MDKLPRVDCSRGAPMGRGENHHADRDKPLRFHLRHIRLDSGGYDEGGAYWGLRMARDYVRPDGCIVRVVPRLFWYFNVEHGVCAFVEAAHRDDAKAKIREQYYPNATFFN